MKYIYRTNKRRLNIRAAVFFGIFIFILTYLNVFDIFEYINIPRGRYFKNIHIFKNRRGKIFSKIRYFFLR